LVAEAIEDAEEEGGVAEDLSVGGRRRSVLVSGQWEEVLRGFVEY